jgi:hypothetical protein
MLEHQGITYTGYVDTNRRLCELQFSDILTFVASTPALHSPESALSYHIAMKNRRRFRSFSELSLPNRHIQLQDWVSNKSSALIVIQGNFAAKAVSRDLAVSVIEVIKATDIPVIWALTSKNRDEDNGSFSTRVSAIDVLKHLVFQVLRLNHTLLNERSIALNAAQYKSATTESDWFDLLGLVLRGLPQIYIVIDVELVSADFGETNLWPEAFRKLFEDLVASSVVSILKVALVSYRTRLSVTSQNLDGGAVLHITQRGRLIESAKPRRVQKSRRAGKGNRTHLYSQLKRH